MKKTFIKNLIKGEYEFGKFLEAKLMNGLSLSQAEETLREISQMRLPGFLRRRAEAEASLLREDIEWWEYVDSCEKQLAAQTR